MFLRVRQRSVYFADSAFIGPTSLLLSDPSRQPYLLYHNSLSIFLPAKGRQEDRSLHRDVISRRQTCAIVSLHRHPGCTIVCDLRSRHSYPQGRHSCKFAHPRRFLFRSICVLCRIHLGTSLKASRLLLVPDSHGLKGCVMSRKRISIVSHESLLASLVLSNKHLEIIHLRFLRTGHWRICADKLSFQVQVYKLWQM